MFSRIAVYLVALFVAGISTCAEAQNPNNIMGLFGTMMRTAVIEHASSEWRKLPQNELDCLDRGLQQQGDSIRQQIERGITPGDPRLSGLRFGCRTATTSPPPVSPQPRNVAVETSALSAKPTFNCATARSPSGRILCLDQEGAKADWDLTSAYWALSFSLNDAERAKFEKEHEIWFPTLNRSCRLQAEQAGFSIAQRVCVLSAFRKRAELFRSQLRGDALAESRLSPELHAQLQQALSARQILDSEPDGEFGPSTRAAIRQFQAQSGAPEGAFLTAQQRATLLLEPSSAGPGNSPEPKDTARLKESRVFLEDAQKFIAGQTTVPSIAAIATEAATLQIALTKFDEIGAVQSMKKLNDLLRPINGFEQFFRNKQAERQREYTRQLAEAKSKGAQNLFYIDSYVKSNLGDSKTTALIKLGAQIEGPLKRFSTEEIDKANDALQAYLKENDLINSYDLIVKTFSKGPTSFEEPKSIRERLGVGPKSPFVIDGPADHIILLYNSSPSAPAVWKNVRGDILFQSSAASLCFGQTNPDAALTRYVERLLNQQGASKVTRAPVPCELSKVGSSTDIIAFERGELLKQPETYIAALVRTIEDDVFREYRIVTDYSSTVQQFEAFSLQLETEVDKRAREGYGVLAVGDSATVCIITPDQSEKVDGIKVLLARDQDLISPKLTGAWRFVATTADLAYLGVQRRQCGYLSGDANVLRPVMIALRREQMKYRVSPVWFTPEEVSRATFDARDEREQQLRKERERLRKLEEDAEIARLRREKNENQKSEIEARLRQQYGVRARSLKDGIHGEVKKLAERRPSETERRFPAYTNWLRGRFADQWETFEVTTEIDDFGSVMWKGRLLDGIIVKTVVQQKNRIRGEYGRDCFVFGLMDDVEFLMLREMFGEACANSDQVVRNWKIANQFQSLWNAEQRSEAGKPEDLALDAASPQPPRNRLAAVVPSVPFDPPVAFKPEPPVQRSLGESVAAADPAINRLDQVIAANPDDAAALSRRGQLFVLRGNFPFAIRDFNEVLRIRPKDAEAYNNRCWARAIAGDLQTALRDCNEALSIRPSYADALDTRGFVDLKIGHPNDATADYDAALRINPRQASSLHGRGIAKIRGGDVASGTLDISAAKALQANIADEFATLGIR
jgi:tetratricopeptide (TPR) repeat protein/peptidoglycan hydrolase-like protein with peptidoglycan-binding domain/uncharacterized protein YecT (DUF1311 family)